MRTALPQPGVDRCPRRIVELVRVPTEREPWRHCLAQQEWALRLAERERGGSVVARFEGVGVPRIYAVEEWILDLVEDDPCLDEVRVHHFDRARDGLRHNGLALLGLLEAHDAILWDTKWRVPIHV